MHGLEQVTLKQREYDKVVGLPTCFMNLTVNLLYKEVTLNKGRGSEHNQIITVYWYLRKVDCGDGRWMELARYTEFWHRRC